MTALDDLLRFIANPPAGSPSLTASGDQLSDFVLTASDAGGNPATYSLGQDAFENMALGSALSSISAGSGAARHNVGIGGETLQALTSGDNNTALGWHTLQSVTTGTWNVAIGSNVLWNCTTGTFNTAVGPEAMSGNGPVTGSFNVAVGEDACFNNTSGHDNVGVGFNALFSNTTAAGMIAVGTNALEAAGPGADYSVAVGNGALTAITSGSDNQAMGHNAGQNMTTATQNLALGTTALFGIVAGSNNVAVGYNAGNTDGTTTTTDISNATLVGAQTTATAGNVVCLGRKTKVTAGGGVAIGVDNTPTPATCSVANQFVLGTALHQIKVSNNTTGGGSALLGANCPAVTVSAPYTWFKMTSSDGSTVYVPAWK